MRRLRTPLLLAGRGALSGTLSKVGSARFSVTGYTAVTLDIEAPVEVVSDRPEKLIPGNGGCPGPIGSTILVARLCDLLGFLDSDQVC
jgi:hypothetical protein